MKRHSFQRLAQLLQFYVDSEKMHSSSGYIVASNESPNISLSSNTSHNSVCCFVLHKPDTINKIKVHKMTPFFSKYILIIKKTQSPWKQPGRTRKISGCRFQTGRNLVPMETL